MAALLTDIWGPLASAGAALAGAWYADVAFGARHRHPRVTAPMPCTVKVTKPFNGISRRPTEGSS